MNYEKIARKEMGNMAAYIPGMRSQEAIEKYGLTHVVKLASNENPLGPSPKAIEAIAEAAKVGHIYPDSTAWKLRTLLAGKHKVTPEQVIVTAGGEELIRLFSGAYIAEGDEVIISELGFGLHFRGGQMQGAKIMTIPVKADLSDDIDGMINAISQKTKVVFITNPSNPTGHINKRADMEKLFKAVPKDVLIMVDEAYFEFAVEHEEYPDCMEYLADYPNMIILRTLSKVVGLAGVRVGYGVASAGLIAQIMKLKAAFNVSILALEGAYAALLDEAHIDRTILENRNSLNMFKEYFDKKGLKYVKPGGNFIFVDLGVGSFEAHQDLIKLGLIVRPGGAWGKDAFTRISSGTIEETKFAIDILDKYLASK